MATTDAHPAPSRGVNKPTRTRVLSQHQSKNGCFTCKARRIKCDETFPICLRCSRSGKNCEGYPQRASAAPTCRQVSKPEKAQQWLSNRPSITLSPQDVLPITSAQDRLAKLGMGLLKTDSFDCFGTSGPILDYLLPQLVFSLPSVNAAAAALGSAYLMHAPSSFEVSKDPGVLLAQYVQALKTMQTDLLSRPHGLVPLILACLLLAVAEVVLKKEDNALVHMRGAFQLLGERRTSQQAMALRPARSEIDLPFDDLEVLFKGLDLQTAAYGLGFKPDLPLTPIPVIMPEFSSLSSARNVLLQIVHHVFAWCAAVYTLKYRPWQATSQDTIEQGRLISCLSMFLERFDREILLATTPDTADYAQVLSLRAECLTTLTHVSTSLDGHETANDMHASRFQQIIQDVEIVARLRNRRTGPELNSKTFNFGKFSTGPGLSRVLFFVARRYREPKWRRRAILLLDQAGREGPWLGPREAAACMRCAQYEEGWPDPPPPYTDLEDALEWRPRHGRPEKASDIPECARIHGVVQNHDQYPLLDNRTRASFGRCPDIEALLVCDCGPVAEKSPLSTDDDSPVQVQTLHGHWDIWEEELCF